MSPEKVRESQNFSSESHSDFRKEMSAKSNYSSPVPARQSASSQLRLADVFWRKSRWLSLKKARDSQIFSGEIPAGRHDDTLLDFPEMPKSHKNVQFSFLYFLLKKQLIWSPLGQSWGGVHKGTRNKKNDHFMCASLRSFSRTPNSRQRARWPNSGFSGDAEITKSCTVFLLSFL